MGVETLITREVLREAGFTSRQTFVICLILAFIWGLGGYLFGQVEVLSTVQLKLSKKSVTAKDLKNLDRKRLAADKKILATSFEVSDGLDQKLVEIKRKVLKNSRLPAGNTAEPLRQLKEKLK